MKSYFYCSTLFIIIMPLYALTPADHYHLYLWGYYNQLENNMDIAQECYTKIFNNNGSLYTYPGYVEFLFQLQKYPIILQLMPSLEESLKDCFSLQKIFIKTLEIAGKREEADKKIIALGEKFKNKPEFAYNTALAYIRINDIKKAITVLDAYLKNSAERTEHAMFYFLKAQLYMKSYNKKEALTMVKKCLELNPSFQEGWLFSGIINELEGDLNEAITGYSNFLTFVGHDAAVEQQLLMLFFKKNTSSLAQEPHSLPSFEKALQLYKQKKYKESLDELNAHLNKSANDEQARLLKIQLLCSLGNSKDALNTLEKWIKEDKKEIWFRALHLLYLAKVEQSAIITLLKNKECEDKTNAIPLLYLADIYLKQKNFSEAKKYLSTVISLPINKNIQRNVVYQLAIVHFEEKNFPQLEKLYETYKELVYELAPFANLFAYYYASKNRNLQTAQKLINTALQENKNNIHFLDTQALILYKKKEYEQALGLLKNINQEDPHDFFILKHLSKIYEKKGNVNEAIYYMEKALTYCPKNEYEKYAALIESWKKIKNS